MTTSKDAGSNGDAVYWDSFSPEISANPYSLYKRLRDQAPLYYSREHDFYAVSRFVDVERCLGNHQTFSSARATFSRSSRRTSRCWAACSSGKIPRSTPLTAPSCRGCSRPGE